MSDDNRNPRSHWPKYLPYTPITMGMISPEWTYMGHFFDQEEEEEQNPNTSSFTSRSLQTPAIQINFRPRSK
ncbi:hypothetical protein [Hazenella coriacea]|uniref:Uncharacterized protein n=1 Tax=Hazenella coriacea TaxID=1179467 RepID=A0A4R3LAA7_9BACL|nr:hypothetical protein [Hazenella coriacea]TCS96669.1 hypothetical protein EDD58_101305 [Hazenella coriacea]